MKQHHTHYNRWLFWAFPIFRLFSFFSFFYFLTSVTMLTFGEIVARAVIADPVLFLFQKRLALLFSCPTFSTKKNTQSGHFCATRSSPCIVYFGMTSYLHSFLCIFAIKLIVIGNYNKATLICNYNHNNHVSIYLMKCWLDQQKNCEVKAMI